MAYLAFINSVIILAAIAIIGANEEFPDKRGPPTEMIQSYRECCVQCLTLSNYSKPGPYTLETLAMFIEAEFLLSADDQMHTFLLVGNLVRLALREGLHRDSTKVAGNSTPFQAEMRRRIWNHISQIDMLASTHIGLPGMVGSIQSDTLAPKNLQDEDFDEESQEVPASRPDSEYTPMSYTICKGRLCHVAAMISAIANSLVPTPYAEIMRVDALLHDAWERVPKFFRLDPTAISVVDAPVMIIKKFSITLLYEKSRCMLHRGYLLRHRLNPVFGYSKVVGLDAAMQLLRCQLAVHETASPGGALSGDKWFLSMLAMHDFLLADMILYLSIMQSLVEGVLDPQQQDMIMMLKRSHKGWNEMSNTNGEAKKAYAVVGSMLNKIQLALGCSVNRPAVHGDNRTASGDIFFNMSLDGTNLA